MARSGFGFSISGVRVRGSVFSLFRVSRFGVTVSGFGFGVSSFRVRGSGFSWFGVSRFGFGFRVSRGFRNWGSSFQVRGFEVSHSGLGFRIRGSGFSLFGVFAVRGFQFRVSSSGFSGFALGVQS